MKQIHKKRRVQEKSSGKRRDLAQVGRKITVSALQLRKISQELLTQFPAAVDDETLRLVLLDVDPHMIHAYWNVPLNNSMRIPPKSEKRLRIYRLPDMLAPLKRSLSWFEIPVQGLRSQQYIDVDKDNAVYVAQLGYALPGGRFVQLVTSNRVQTPPAVRRAADRATVELRALGGYVNEHTIARAQETYHPAAAIASLCVPRPSVLLDEEYIDALIRQRLRIQHDPLTCDDQQPVPALPYKGLRDRPTSVSSFSVFPRNEDVGLRAELVIEGRVRPGTRLMLHGKEVTLEPDGTFRIRHTLPADERLFRLLKGVNDFAPSPDGDMILTATQQRAARDKVQVEMFASVCVYGKAENKDVVATLGPEVVTLPDGRIYYKRILPHGMYILPELLVAAPQEGDT